MKKKTTIVFSINVHENVKFLQKQIEDIEANVLLDFVVLINANEFMYNEIINNKPLMAKAAKAFIELYPEPINKIHNHGTLTKGIYLNMEYSMRCRPITNSKGFSSHKMMCFIYLYRILSIYLYTDMNKK
jgi:hypothetical protein